jgi:predicted dehydrogenase
MEAVLASGFGQASAICDPSAEMTAAAQSLAPGAVTADTLEGLLQTGPDGIVIATPSAQHAEQSIQALDAGVAVFCQKPLGRNAEEVAAVVEAARRNDLLLGVDLSYRHTRAMRTIRDRLKAGAIGKVYAADLTFHNAYGPDKRWFYDARLSGGGCVMDLGVHLVDLLLWALDFPAVETVSADLYAGGQKMTAAGGPVEDFAVATIGLDSGVTARFACSWRLHAGQDAVISATFYGTEGALRFSNVGGSFYDFTAEQLTGTKRELLVEPPDGWGGRAAVSWAERLATDKSYDPRVARLIAVAETLDRIYGR